MEIILASGIGLLTACGLYLLLRPGALPMVLGFTLLSYAVSLLLLASGRLMRNAPPLLEAGASRFTDPLPQALVLTAIVISFGMTAYLIALLLRAKAESGTGRPESDEPRA